MKAKDIERFWSKVERKTKSGCWEWTAGKNTAGYGYFHLGGKMIRAHRMSWQLENGEIPEEMSVCHHCDNPKCVRPDHLFLGTHTDNMRDRNEKGRQAHPKGGKNGMFGRTGEKSSMFGRTGERAPMFGRTGEKHPMFGKGYLQQGERSPNAKLDNTAVRIIRTLYRDFEFEQIELANVYGVSRALISLVINRKAWKHI